MIQVNGNVGRDKEDYSGDAGATLDAADGCQRQGPRSGGQGAFGKARQFLDQRNAAGETALMLASRYGHMEVVELLLKAGANTEGAMDEAIAAAKSDGQTEEEIGEAIAAGAVVPGVPAAAVAAAVGSMEKAFE